MIWNKNWMGFKVAAQKDIMSQAIEIFIIRNNPDGSIHYLKEAEMGYSPPEEGYNAVPFPNVFRLPYELAQRLMDELWHCGLRPSEGTGSAGSLKATQDHLQDMRKIVWKVLRIEEK
jgi:hypothetical protein